MEEWLKISLILCCVGCLKEFRPVEPFLTQYFLNPPINFTDEQVTQDIYPVGTYSTMTMLILVFLVTDYLRYKPVILIHTVSAIICYTGLVTVRSIFAMQIFQVTYGLSVAAEVSYYTYIYSKVEKKHFQVVTSYTRSACLTGRAFSGIAAQFFTYFNILSYFSLNYLTIGGLVLAFLCSLTLPPVKTSLYFHRNLNDKDYDYEEAIKPPTSNTGSAANIINPKEHVKTSYRIALHFLWKDFTAAFTNFYVLKWAFWWALATCGFYQVLSYTQLLWSAIMKDNNNTEQQWNGAVEMLYTIIGAVSAFLCGRIRVNWEKYGELVLALCSLGQGAVLLIMSMAGSLMTSYVTYILFTIMYHTMITIANSEVAKHVREDSYGLIFGVTTFLALVFQTILTYFVTGSHGFALTARPQFLVYAGYFTVLGSIFVLAIIVRIIRYLFEPCSDGYTI